MPEETVPCPGCAAPMGLDQEVCPACRRPRDEQEIQRGRDLLRENAEKRRRRPFLAARWALVVAALVLAFRQRQFLFGLTAGLRDEVHQEIKNVENPPLPKGTAPKTAMGAAAIAMLGGPPSAKARAQPAETEASAPPASSSTPPKIAVRPKEPKEPGNGYLRLYGVVFDLKSLRPIANATVNLGLAGGDGSHNEYVRLTDGDGAYQIDFIPFTVDASASVTVSADGYRDGQIEDPEGSYLRRPLKERLELIAEFTPTDLESVPLRYRSTDTIIPLDMALVPEEAPAK